MTVLAKARLADLIARVYQDAYAVHGDLNLEPTYFAERLRRLLESQLELGDSILCRLKLLNSLYTTDLYLSLACAQAGDAAWRRFLTVYEKRILQFAIFITGHRDVGHDLADNVITDLFLPDTTGKSRIASYDGRRALIVWLRAVVSHQASKQRELKCNHFERVEDVTNCIASATLETTIVAHRYAAAINDSFEIAAASLTQYERNLLLLRYDQAVHVKEIARALAVHSSTVTRQLQQAERKLGKRIIRVLATKHQFGPAAIKECLSDIVENPLHSLLPFLKAG